MSTRTACCSCGRLRVTTRGDPLRVSICHCLACQRRTGSVFGVQARFRLADVRIEGAATVYERIGDSGVPIQFHFCPACGATVYYTLADLPDIVAVPVGAFADPGFPTPLRSVYEARMHDWVRLPTAIEHFD